MFTELTKTKLLQKLNSNSINLRITQSILNTQINWSGGCTDSTGKKIDSRKFLSWLIEHANVLPLEERTLSAYQANIQRAKERNAALSRMGRDIGEIPACKDRDRKQAGQQDLQTFLELYFPNTYKLCFSPDHIRLINSIQHKILHGGREVIVLPRGSGKTCISEHAVIWSILSQNNRFPLLIGADIEAALIGMESIKSEFMHNDLLAEDFPEYCHPIRLLEGIAKRAGGQIYHDKPVGIVWLPDVIVLPDIQHEDIKYPGSIIRTTGITGSFLGMKHKLRDGTVIRPDLVMIDDPQTQESSKSPLQNLKRESTIQADVMGLAGPGKSISIIMPCTPKKRGDLVCMYLDRARHPDWSVSTAKFFTSMPLRMDLWDQYGKIYAEEMSLSQSFDRSTGFYKDNLEAMQQDAVVYWGERFDPQHELDAIQHGMNLYYKLGKEAFYSEYQVEPIDDLIAGKQIDENLILSRLVGEVTELPANTQRLTAFIDVHLDVLFFLVVAWDNQFGGIIVDYGCYPEQNKPVYYLNGLDNSLMDGKVNYQGALSEALATLTKSIFAANFRLTNGGLTSVSKCLIDANYGESTDTVYDFCHRSAHRARLLPSHGKYYGVRGKTIPEYTPNDQMKIGHNWLLNKSPKRPIAHTVFDTNYWKSHCYRGLMSGIGETGAITISGIDPAEHQLLAIHLSGEYHVQLEENSRKATVWKPHAGKENHWFDCLVGCAVGANIEGVEIPRITTQKIQNKRRRTVGEIRAALQGS